MSDKSETEGAAGGDSNAARTPQRRRKVNADLGGTIDITAALEAPVRLKRDGLIKPVNPYEAMLRQHVRKSLFERCVASMKLVLGEAEKHEIIRPSPPPPAQGGVFVIPKDVPEDIWRQIFEDPDYVADKKISIFQIAALLLTVIDIERLKRCFNGR